MPSSPSIVPIITLPLFAEREPTKPLGPFRADAAALAAPVPADALRATWLGHSTVLLEIDGRRFLTDPVWSERVSPMPFAGPKRFFAPPLPLAQLPKLDAVVLSHDHYDHLDPAAIRFLAKSGVVVVSLRQLPLVWRLK